MPFEITGATIQGHKKVEDIVYYVVRVAAQGRSWEVEKRFSAFLALRRTCISKGEALGADFGAKLLFHTEARIRQRERNFDAVLKDLLDKAKRPGGRLRGVRDAFLLDGAAVSEWEASHAKEVSELQASHAKEVSEKDKEIRDLKGHPDMLLEQAEKQAKEVSELQAKHAKEVSEKDREIQGLKVIASDPDKLLKQAKELHNAARDGDCGTLRRLLTEGVPVDVTFPEAYGGTALHYAAFESCPETVRLLCEHGARADIKSGGSQTALQLAGQQKDSSKKREVEQILKAHLA